MIEYFQLISSSLGDICGESEGRTQILLKRKKCPRLGLNLYEIAFLLEFLNDLNYPFELRASYSWPS